MFSGPSYVKYEQHKFFDEMGFKDIEAFQNDILENIESFSYDSTMIAHKTKDFWYVSEKDEKLNIIKMTRFCNRSLRRWDTWMNINSYCVGKEFLKSHIDKKVDFC